MLSVYISTVLCLYLLVFYCYVINKDVAVTYKLYKELSHDILIFKLLNILSENYVINNLQINKRRSKEERKYSYIVKYPCQLRT